MYAAGSANLRRLVGRCQKRPARWHKLGASSKRPGIALRRTEEGGDVAVAGGGFKSAMREQDTKK